MESAKKFLHLTNQLGTFSPKKAKLFFSPTLIPHAKINFERKNLAKFTHCLQTSLISPRITSKISRFVHMFAKKFSNIFLLPLDRQREGLKFRCHVEKFPSPINSDTFSKSSKLFLFPQLVGDENM